MRCTVCMIDITKCPLTLNLTETQIILSNMKLYENDKKVCLIHKGYQNSGLGAFLDITVCVCGVILKRLSCVSTKFHISVNNESQE